MAYDQLSDKIGPLARSTPEELGVVLVESAWKAGQRPYHRHKLALLLSNMRHFALEQAARGVRVRYVTTDAPYVDVLRREAASCGPLVAMEPAEYELRSHLAPLLDEGALTFVPHDGFLTTAQDFAAAGPPQGPWRMDAFYRAVRRRTGVLMVDGSPEGGRFSFDGENRKAWRGSPPPPALPTPKIDDVTREVIALVRSRFERHPGQINEAELPSTRAHARDALRWFIDNALPHFGPYQDAMSASASSLFHSRLSALMHLHRLLPAEVLSAVLEAEVSLACKEGFVRQILGWREYVRHVHRSTDGFRTLFPTDTTPGDGGWANWTMEHWERPAPEAPGGAAPASLRADQPVPPAFWGTPSGLRCVDKVIDQVWSEGYGHHITRLMVLSNVATLLGVSPRALADWFWVAYADAFDWVVEPNVLGMGSYGVGPLMTTKPYVCGAAYISKMGDFCRGCAFDPKKNCPITAMYWDFLAKHESTLSQNRRVQRQLWGLAKRGDERRAQDAAVAETARARMAAGQRLDSP